MTFIPGQRWISITEAQLGLGIITELEGRQVRINFPAAGEERIYAVDNAPLSRIIYKEGDEITTIEEKKLHIKNYSEDEGLIIYIGMDASGELFEVNEGGLSSFIKMSTPEQRLLSGLLDKLSTFKLRIHTLEMMRLLQQSEVRGLLGSRTSLLPHQVYIASEVAKRYAPRVLLADEVGLGKTIEAGLILHYQLHTDRAKRVLIIVPDSLIHQWLIEMMRRFNLYFSIVNDSSYEPIIFEEDEDCWNEEFLTDCNPFEEHSLVLCGLGFLMSNKTAHIQALQSDWDILVVDEAHHLHCTEEEKSPEYLFIEQLSAKSKGLLLLTATPEQMGIESHFARLHLLDSSRFYDCAIFKKEEQEYNKINQLIQKLGNHWENLTFDEIKNELGPYLGDEVSLQKEENMKLLLDRYGTGRVLFRNTRTAIQGFPEREVYSYPLTVILQGILDKKGFNLYPEAYMDADLWLALDPRIEWLVNQLSNLNLYKVLVICTQAKTAMALDYHLRSKYRLRSAAFHEGLSIIERDRAAAYFADSEEEGGAQVLICSEIGSEGRNFQFCHHLVLFDLPLNPDVLEQRIGRLDRIGQQHTVIIHVPYLANTAQEMLFHWYHEGINLFRKSCSFGFSIFETFENQLLPLLQQEGSIKSDKVNELILATKKYKESMDQILQAGRDPLLEMNSCNLPKAEALIAKIKVEERIEELEHYMNILFHEFGVEQEHHSENSEILRPSAHMRVSDFPYLKEEGMTVTYARNKAISREDMEFLSWEHPMVYESMQLILESELGNAVLSTMSLKSIPPGTLFLESFYTVNCASPQGLQLHRFLPLMPFRIFMDVQGKNLSKILNYNQLNELCQPVKTHLGNAILKQIRPNLELIIKKSNEIAELEKEGIIRNSLNNMRDILGEETKRLVALKQVNTNIRDEELEFLKKQMEASTYYINKAELKLQALRVVINK